MIDSQAYTFFVGASIGVLLLCVLKLATSRPSRAGRWFAAFLACTICFLGYRHVHAYVPWLAVLLEVPLFLLPGALWMFAHTLCREWQPFPRWGVVLIAINFCANISALHLQAAADIAWVQLGEQIFLYSQPVKLVLVISAVAPFARDLTADLSQPRRALRARLLVAIGTFMVLVVGAEIVALLLPQSIAAGANVQIGYAAMTFVLCLLVGLWLFGIVPGRFLPTLEDAARAAVVDAPEAAETPLVAALQQAMQAGAYRQARLSVAALARQLQVPAYQLRQTINRHLGFSNFNEYLNQYRLDDAAAQLVGQPDKKILAVALDAGFGSVSAFNDAFKRKFQQTPSAYRAAHSGRSPQKTASAP